MIYRYPKFSKLQERLIHTDEYVSKVLIENGYKILKPISGGGFGYTFELVDNKVCKITYDRDEIYTANLLIGKKNKYLINYFDVLQGNEFDIIIMEKIDVKSVDENKLDRAEIALSKCILQGRWSDTEFLTIVFEKIPDHIGYLLKLPFNSYLLDIIRMYIESSKYGRLQLDLNHNNFGIKNGHLIAFDFMITSTKDNNYYYSDTIKKLIEIEDKLRHKFF